MKYFSYKRSASRGYTFLELLLVIGIMALLGAITFSSLQSQNNREALEKSALGVQGLLEQARASTLASKNAYEYGVHFDSTRMVLFRGTTYSSSSTTNVTVSLNSRVVVSGISVTGGGSNIIFDRLRGTTATPGTVTLSLASSSTTTKTIRVYSTGIIERN